MPAILIDESADGRRLETEVRICTPVEYRADYRINGRYVASVRRICTRAHPEGIVTMRSVALPHSDPSMAADFTRLLVLAVVHADQIDQQGLAFAGPPHDPWPATSSQVQ